MEVTYIQGALPAKVPVPLFSSVLIGTAENRGTHFNIYLGLDAPKITKLQTYSLDTTDVDLQANTSDFKRFGEGSYDEWYSKGRVPFALTDRDSGALAALVWFGPKPLGRKSLKHLSEEELLREKTVESDDWHTIVFRSYLPYRGTGIMKEFVRVTTDVYLHYFPDAKLWAGINRANPGSLALAAKLGYTINESLSDPTWVAMIKNSRLTVDGN